MAGISVRIGGMTRYRDLAVDRGAYRFYSHGFITKVGADQRVRRGADDAPDACGMGFLASRQGVAERRLVEIALDLCRQFDHRGAPGHGAGLLLDIPWPLLLDRFPDHVRLIAQRDVALGMFFLPWDAVPRRRCGSAWRSWPRSPRPTSWAGPTCRSISRRCPPGAAARRTAPVVRQALFRRPKGLSEDGWLACRYLLRLALDEVLGEEVGVDFSVASLSNRTVVYKGLAELSQIGRALPRPARRGLRLALRAVPQPLQHEHHHRLAPRAAVLGPGPQRRDLDHQGQRRLDGGDRAGPRAAARRAAPPPEEDRRARALDHLRGGSTPRTSTTW